MRVTRRLLAAASAAAVATGLGLAMAPSASADQVWHQAFVRSSADAPCPAPAGETAWEDGFTGQREWTPSWALWPNDGKGGWVCERTIIWAHDGGSDGSPATPSIGCQQFGPGFYVLFGAVPAVPSGTLNYENAACTTPGITNGYPLVYAPDGIDQAEELCGEYAPYWTTTLEHYASNPVWGCVGYP